MVVAIHSDGVPNDRQQLLRLLLHLRAIQLDHPANVFLRQQGFGDGLVESLLHPPHLLYVPEPVVLVGPQEGHAPRVQHHLLVPHLGHHRRQYFGREEGDRLPDVDLLQTGVVDGHTEAEAFQGVFPSLVLQQRVGRHGHPLLVRLHQQLLLEERDGADALHRVREVPLVPVGPVGARRGRG